MGSVSSVLMLEATATPVACLNGDRYEALTADA